MRGLVFIVAALIFSSCQKSDVKYDKQYFDFDSLISKQVKALTHSKWRKVSRLNQKSDTAVIQPDSMRAELDIFRQLDVINKPIFKEKYLIEEKKDVHSNLMVRSYRFREEDKGKLKSSVPFVDFYYYNQFSDLRKIVSVINERNLLFNSSRQLSLEFEEGNPKKVVAYEIKAFQKMLLADSVILSIRTVQAN